MSTCMPLDGPFQKSIKSALCTHHELDNYHNSHNSMYLMTISKNRILFQGLSNLCPNIKLLDENSAVDELGSHQFPHYLLIW